ncbi:hypothetical protein Caka_0466 [Coraliomargarita akajimensis DSM 45221]|uniref:GH16 domain-containing protein n=1 Tax=Coraliomargarita akajimensis (strain DSM 45221 / IAM 15411 / JCM 23193 / KCTC 12865 / 04OKA010-24) TaxID=583355 RepID=D5EN56_CORAD|nr:hypothetical protein Caka_0466 [Coraliomargarita akajimensis DSM 45221]
MKNNPRNKHRHGGFRKTLAFGSAILALLASTQIVNAVNPPSNYGYRAWQSDDFNGGFKTDLWTKSTQKFPAVAGGSGREVWYYTWMVDNTTVGGKQCLRIKGNSYGTVDKGGRLDSKYTWYRWGWYEASTKVSGLNEYVWPTWWTFRNGGEELDIMEYAWGDLSQTHWRHDGSSRKQGNVVWWKGDSYIQNNIVNKFSTWSVDSPTSGNTKFYKDRIWKMSGAPAAYEMQLLLSSGPNRRRAGTPNNATFPDFYVDYVKIWAAWP